MEGMTEKLSVRFTDNGVAITGNDGDGAAATLRLSPSEALMLLDILQTEAKRLAILAEEASPLPMRVTADFRK